MSSARPSSSTLGRILRSASFRLTLFYAALFIASAGALFATVYVTATAAMQNDMAAVLRSEAFQLAEVHSRTLDTHMKRLRQKLGDHAAMVETVRGIGYCVSSL